MAGGASQAAVLSTCNRTEIYYAGGSEEAVIGALAAECGVSEANLRGRAYSESGSSAARHLFRVAAGMDSAVLGETEIVAQVKAAWKVSRESAACGPDLELAFRRAMEAGKRIRTETGISKNVTSVPVQAVRRAGSLRSGSLVLLGAGSMAMRLAKELRAAGASEVWVVNRSVETAEHLARGFGWNSAGLEELGGLLARARVLFAAAATPEPLVTREMLRAAKDLTIFDLGVPGNVERADDEETARLIRLEELQEMCAANEQTRLDALPHADSILEHEVGRYVAAQEKAGRALGSATLAAKGERIRKRNLEWALANLPNLSAQDRAVLDEFSFRLANGLLDAAMPTWGERDRLA